MMVNPDLLLRIPRIITAALEVRDYDTTYEYVQNEGSYQFDTSMGPVTLVLPANPIDKFRIEICDYFKSWMINPLVIHRNGNRIMGVEEHLNCDVPGSMLALIYTRTSMGWIVDTTLTKFLGNK